MTRRKRPPTPKPTSEQTTTKKGATSDPSTKPQASEYRMLRYLPSRETKSFEVLINAGEPCLSVQYNPHELINELNKLFGLMYLGFGVPASFLVKPDSPMAGIFTAWFAVGSTQSQDSPSDRRKRRLTLEKIESLLKSIADGNYDRPTEGLLERVKQFAQGGNEESARYIYVVGRWTTLATDYIAQHLPEKLQSALIQLALEAQLHSLSVTSAERGFKKVGSKQGLVDIVLGTEQKLIKTRLQTRRPGGSPAKYDFSALPELYEQAKKHFREVKKVLAALDNPSRERARLVVSAACDEIDLDLVDRMLDGQDYLSTPSHLAVEWAARRCGVPANRGEEYPTSYLLQVLSEKRKK